MHASVPELSADLQNVASLDWPAFFAYSACMKKKPIQYTIRSVPQDLDDALRKNCVKEGTSLNSSIVDALKKGVGLSDTPALYHDLDYLSGTWVQDKACEKALKEFDRIDEDLWA